MWVVTGKFSVGPGVHSSRGSWAPGPSGVDPGPGPAPCQWHAGHDARGPVPISDT